MLVLGSWWDWIILKISSNLADSVIPCDSGKGQTRNPMDFAKMPPAPVAGAKGEQTHVLHVAFLSSVWFLWDPLGSGLEGLGCP